MQGVNRTLMAVSFLSFSVLSFNGYAQQQEQTVEEAETDPKTQACLMQKLNEAEGDALVAQLRQECEVEVDTELRDRNNREAGAISKRFLREKETNFDPYVITPHKMNYILPISYTDSINRKEYAESVPSSNWAENLEDYEAKYQLSIKVPLNYGDLFFENDSLYFGMTLQSWWQVYSENISKPFRETNYQPEIFYLTGLDWHPFDGNTGIMFGAEHQSNGRSNAISRSWNRIYTSLLWENGDFALAGRVWYRLEEDEKDFPGDSDGDDNPDINDFMGYGSISMAYQYDVVEFAVNVRHNFATHKGGVEAGMTFPLWGKLKGYVQYTGGYGESLIDYDHKQNRIGIGLALTEVL